GADSDHEDQSVLGYDATSATRGKLLWHAGDAHHSYCSPQPARLAGADQVLLTSDIRLTAFDATHGVVLWEYEWPLGKDMNRVVQPALLDGDDVLLGTGFGKGTRRLHVKRNGDKWETEDVWSTQDISPYFNDLVVHK